MESRAFISAARQLIERIKFSAIGSATIEEERAKREEIQKEINSLFSALQNPTLPSAFALRDAALAEGFTVSNSAKAKLEAFEDWSS